MMVVEPLVFWLNDMSKMYYLKNTKGKTAKKKSEKATQRGGEKRNNVQSLIKKLDATFSLYIRLRDSRQYGYKYFKCISCGQVLPFEQMDCGHFIGRTHMSTRFDELNCHGECRRDNRFSSDHIIYYQKNLEQKIGKEKLDLLIARGNQTKKWTAWELTILIDYYKDQNKRMLEERGY